MNRAGGAYVTVVWDRPPTRDGRRDALGSWYVPYDEGCGEYRGSTMFPRGRLFSFEIVGLDGRPLLTIPT
ncbi:hypothetical protein GCM10010187_31450 [Actinomadura coerulea]|nr:hypothetical protein GCM10010187_31450 [Actinomadura coerulea]